MSTPDVSPEQQKYYDPAEVEAYVKDATNTIRTLQGRLQEAARRAEEADRGSADQHPDTASLGRALLLAGEVADKTIADADTRAATIIRAAEERAAGIIQTAHTEAHRLVEAARASAADAFEIGEARLLAAVSAFVDGTDVLRSELARIANDAAGWRSSIQPPQPPEPTTFTTPRSTSQLSGQLDNGGPPRRSGQAERDEPPRLHDRPEAPATNVSFYPSSPPQGGAADTAGGAAGERPGDQ